MEEQGKKAKKGKKEEAQSEMSASGSGNGGIQGGKKPSERKATEQAKRAEHSKVGTESNGGRATNEGNKSKEIAGQLELQGGGEQGNTPEQRKMKSKAQQNDAEGSKKNKENKATEMGQESEAEKPKKGRKSNNTGLLVKNGESKGEKSAPTKARLGNAGKAKEEGAPYGVQEGLEKECQSVEYVAKDNQLPEEFHETREMTIGQLARLLHDVGLLEKDAEKGLPESEAMQIFKELINSKRRLNRETGGNVLANVASKKGLFSLPVLALKGTVCFPHSVVPLLVARDKSVAAVERAMEDYGGAIAVVTEKNPSIDEVDPSNMHKACSVGRVIQKIKLPSGTTKVLIDIEYRAKITEFDEKISHLEALVELQKDDEEDGRSVVKSVLARSVANELKKYAALKKMPQESISEILNSVESPSLMSDMVASFVQSGVQKKLAILEAVNLEERLEKILTILFEENEILNVDQEIQNKVRMQIDKNQKEYYLNEQIKAIRKELGDSDGIAEAVIKYEQMLAEKEMPQAAEAKIKEEIRRLKHATAMSADSIRSYLDWVLGLPWGRTANDEVSLMQAGKEIVGSHYGLDKVKATILEYIIAQIGQEKQKGAILCLYGPPGVGKTTLVKSIAKAMGRKYAKISLGGVRDEAEIRGHRKTYIAAMPGKIIQTIKKVGVDNPVILLDEIDKMAHDYRGDPESALLEVLDPDQNQTFQDSYLEVDYDLSKVIFISTANSLNMQRALLDRLELIDVPSYLQLEKVAICMDYILPKCLQEYGIPEGTIQIKREAIEEIIEFYTRESGVRELGRLINKIVRKSLVRLMMEKESTEKASASHVKGQGVMREAQGEQCYNPEKGLGNTSDPENLPQEHEETDGKISNVHIKDVMKGQLDSGIEEINKILALELKDGKIVLEKKDIKQMLGVRKYVRDELEKNNLIGVVNGLAYTEVGGEILVVEAVTVGGGKGEVKLTGKLGEVMKESTQASFSYIKSKSKELGIDMNTMKDHDIHIHIPAGGVPKDGPSAGITFCTALVSLLKSIPVRQDIAMTGEISLRGRVLPIGGLREKITAANRAGIKTVIIPQANQKNLESIPKSVMEGMQIIPCETLDQVLDIALYNGANFKSSSGLSNIPVEAYKQAESLMV